MEIEKKNEFPYDEMFFFCFSLFQNSPNKYCNLYMSVIIIRKPTKRHFTPDSYISFILPQAVSTLLVFIDLF